MVVPAPLAILLPSDSAETECAGKLNRNRHTPIKSSALAPPQIVYLGSFDIIPLFSGFIFMPLSIALM
jgi:hypothetical protein